MLCIMDRKWIYAVILFLKIVIIKAKEPAEIKIKILESCKEYKDIPMIVENLFLDNVGVDQFEVSGTTIVREDVHAPLKMAVDIGRCPSLHSEKCTHAYHPVVDDFCAVIEDRESHPAKFLQLFGVNSTCPIHAGQYPFTPTDFKTDYLKVMASSFGNYWKLQIVVSDLDGNPKFCIFAEAEMVDKKGRKRGFKAIKKANP